MSLKDLVAQTATVSVPSASGPVPLVLRGLGLGAIMALMRNYGDTLESLYTKAAAGEMEADMLGGLISEAMARSGDLVADIIAWGCGEPDQVDQCRLIPVGAQVELLEADPASDVRCGGRAKKTDGDRDPGDVGVQQPRPRRLTDRVWDVREQCSLLLDHGHPDAWSYPVGQVFVEADFVVRRMNVRSANEALLAQMAVSTIPNQAVKITATKSISKLFHEQIKRLLGER